MFNALMLVAVSLLAACGGAEVRSDNRGDFQPDPRPIGKTLVYECTGMDFIARVGPGEMALWVEDRYLILSRVRSASGSRYQEGDVVFWQKGEEALLELGSRRYRDCRLNHARAPWEDARRRGVDFRATGNEPAWYLELQQGRHLLFVGNYGSERVLLPAPEAERAGPTRVYHATSEAHDLRLEITDEPCVDSMQGDSFPAQVLVHLDGRTYWGCGRELEHPWH